MYNMKEKEQFDYSDCNGVSNYPTNRSNSDARDKSEHDFDMSNNIAHSRQTSNRNDNRYDSAGNMRNSSCSPRGNNGNSARSSVNSEYSALNRYYGVPQVRNDIENVNPTPKNRVILQNQNTAGSAMRGTRATESSDYNMYNNKPKVEKKKVSNRAKLCILVVCAIIALAVGLTVANLIPSASAQGQEQSKVDVAIDNQVAQVVDEKGNIVDVALVPTDGGYKYDTKTNWFDSVCDWIENLVG